MIWFVLAICSALLSASSAVIQKKILFRLTALEFSFLVSAIILAVSLFVPFSVDVASIPSSALMILIGKSILGGMAFLLVMMSLEHNQISSALPLLGITPGVTALLSLMLLGESLRPWEWVGIGLMMAGTYTLEIRPDQKIFQPFKVIFTNKNFYYIRIHKKTFLSNKKLEEMESKDPDLASALHKYIAQLLSERLADSNHVVEALLE